MQNNKIAQIVYRTIYITLGFIGIIGSFGYFNRRFNQDFYVMYTNLSNYFCIGVTLYLLIKILEIKMKKNINIDVNYSLYFCNYDSCNLLCI